VSSNPSCLYIDLSKFSIKKTMRNCLSHIVINPYKKDVFANQYSQEINEAYESLFLNSFRFLLNPF